MLITVSYLYGRLVMEISFFSSSSVNLDTTQLRLGPLKEPLHMKVDYA